jgi:Na+-transporting NADH:ubiquinone oxidoreductase subunit F
MNPMITASFVVVFTFVILALVAVLLVAKRKLVASGRSRSVINGDPSNRCASRRAERCSRLAAQKIFIPSACGGGGTCACARCKVSRRRRQHPAHRDRPHQQG